MKLLTLPNEVLLMITDFLAPPSILSLIRANHYTHTLLSPLLINNFRNNRTLSEEYGLKALYFAAERGDKDTVKRLLGRGLLTYVGDGALLNSAVVTQSDAVIRTLLDCGVDVNTRDSEMRTPLYIVTSMGRIGALKILLERPDIDVNVENQKQESPLQHLLGKGDEATLRALLQDKRVDVNRPSKNGRAPIHEAIRRNRTIILGMLMEDSRINVNSVGHGGWAPLHLAIRMRNDKAFHMALEHPDINVNAQDESGQTPLHFAVRWEVAHMLVALVKRRDVKFDLTNIFGRTAFKYAVESGQVELAQLFPPDAGRV